MPPGQRLDPRIPLELAALPTDPRLALHDGRFHEATVDTTAQAVVMVINGGSLEVTCQFGPPSCAAVTVASTRSYASSI